MLKNTLFLIGLMIFGVESHAKPGEITTLVGVSDAYSRAVNLDFDPVDLVQDPQGNIYVLDHKYHRILKLSLEGKVIFIAGNGMMGYSGDGGQAIDAQLRYPKNLVLDREGNLFFSEKNHIRKVDAKGMISTVLGAEKDGLEGEGIEAMQANLGRVQDLSLDAYGQLYIARDNDIRVLRDGFLYTFAGTGERGLSGDGGLAVQARFDNISSICFDSYGNLLLSDTNNGVIRKITISGFVYTVGGRLRQDENRRVVKAGRKATSVDLGSPRYVQVDHQGKIYFYDQNKLWGIGSQGSLFKPVSLTSSEWVRAFYLASSGTFFTIKFHSGVHHLYADGEEVNLLASQEKKRKIDADESLDNSYNVGIALGALDTLYFSEPSKHRVSQVDSFGKIRRVAGTSKAGNDGDGHRATMATLQYPRGLVLNTEGVLYITDIEAMRIRQVDLAGDIDAVAVKGRSFPLLNTRDIKTSSDLDWGSVENIDADAFGNIYITTFVGMCTYLMKLNSEGVDTILMAISLGERGMCEYAAPIYDHGLIIDIAVDLYGHIFMADLQNSRILKLDQKNNLTTVAGTGQRPKQGAVFLSNKATEAPIAPFGLAVDTKGQFYISDLRYQQILKVDLEGNMVAVVGNGQRGFSKDGTQALEAKLNYPHHLKVDHQGSIYFVERGNNLIRKVEAPDTTAPTGGLQINQGMAVTNDTHVQLSLFCKDTQSECKRVRVSDVKNKWGHWQSFSDTISWQLASNINQTYTVYAQYEDEFSNVSTTSSASIVLDTVAPKKPEVVWFDGQLYTGKSIDLSGRAEALNHVYLFMDKEVLAYTPVDKKGNWRWSGILPLYAGEGFSVQAIDPAGNMSEIAQWKEADLL